ncbi:Uncharacterized protein P5673_005655 [Acropora cervicornis]|uniref:Integrase zinc-binding domain-containing protein n=1 Tax=Acropora cervicornis TaxID=6130 RepID=A0AAD9VCV8_ACRCE|nr:Uncharacterized protein P5673_005655 [Acropora cervicornis]
MVVVGGLIVRGGQIAVSKSLHRYVVRLPHERHQGITKTKEYLGTLVWIPGLDKMVPAHIQHCQLCQIVTLSQEQKPLLMAHLLREPWKDVAIAFWGQICAGEYLLVTVCKQFRLAEFVSSTSATAVIPKLNKTFASLDIPLRKQCSLFPQAGFQ